MKVIFSCLDWAKKFGGFLSDRVMIRWNLIFFQVKVRLRNEKYFDMFGSSYSSIFFFLFAPPFEIILSGSGFVAVRWKFFVRFRLGCMMEVILSCSDRVTVWCLFFKSNLVMVRWKFKKINLFLSGCFYRVMWWKLFCLFYISMFFVSFGFISNGIFKFGLDITRYLDKQLVISILA